MGAEWSKADKKKLKGRAFALAKNTLHSGWQQVAQDFLVAAPQGMPIKCKEKKVLDICLAILSEQLDTQQGSSSPEDLVTLLSVFQRLVMAKGLYALLPKIDFQPFVQVSASKDHRVVHQVLVLLKQMMESPVESAGVDYKTSQKLEASIKEAFAQSEGYEAVASLLYKYKNSNNEDVIVAALELLHSVMVTHQSTTEPLCLTRVLQLLQQRCETILFTFSHSGSPSIRIFSCAIVKKLLTDLPDAHLVTGLQKRALPQGLLLHQFLFAVSEEKAQASQINISRELIRLISDDNEDAISTIQRIVPPSIFATLEKAVATDGAPAGSSKKMQKTNSSRAQPKLVKAGENRKSRAITNPPDAKKTRTMTLAEPSQNSKHNWPAFWAAIEGNACSPTMVWNDDTRRELVTKLRQEGHSFDQRRKKKGDAEWDWQSYEIQYASLSNQLLIGKYYVRLLIPALRGDTCSVEEPLAYLLDLYNHAVVEDDPRQKLLILQCMTTLFERYKETISVVPIMPYLVWLLKEDHYHVEWRQQVLIFLRSLFSLSQNIINFVYAGGIRVLLYHLNLCHSQEKDFQGKPLHPPSLAKFCLLLLEVAIGTPVGSKRLASPECFQYIVQALLLERFEVVDLTIKLVSKILDDHAHLVPTLYSTGIFSFIMAALRTACTPKIIHFLKTYHDAQLAFQMPPSLARLPSPSERPPSSYSSSASSLLAVSPRRERGQKVSYLSYYLPQSMISLLRGEDEKAFASLLKSKCMRSNVIWGEQHLVLLTEHVNSELEEFRRQLGRSPNARFIYTEPRQVLYPDLEEEIIVDNVYLTFFNSDLECPLPHPVQFMKKLLQLTAQSDHSESYFHTVLCAQGVFLQRFPEDETVTKYQGFESLYALISRDQDSLSAQLLSAEALDLIYKLISLPKGGSDNLQTAVRLNIIGTLGELLHKVTSFRDPSQRSQKLLSNLMRVVNMVVEHQDSTVGISQHPTLVQDLVSLLFRPTSSSSASSPEDEELLLSLLYCIKKMAGARALQTRIVESGGFLYLLLLLLPTEDYQQEQEQEDGSVVEMNEAKTIDRPQSSRLSTKDSLSSSRNSNYSNTATVMIELVKALKSLVFGVLQHESHQQPQTLAANPALQSLLTQILTPSLYHAFLSEPEEQFAAQINTTVESPDLIWNKDMRTELYQWLLDQADRLQSPSSSSSPVSSIYASSLSSSTGSLILPSLSSTGGETPRTLRHNHPRWLARNIQFEYDYLKRELIVQNLYIRPFAQRPDFVVPNPVDFVIAVLDALEDRAEQLVQKLLNDSAAASAPNKNNKRKTSKSSESEDSTDDTDSDSDSDSEDGSSSSVSSKGPSFSHIMKEVTHLTKALHHVLAQQSGERESQALVSLLASLSQTIALFSLLQMQNNTTNLTQTEKGEALVATLRVLRVMASSASCAPVVLEHLNTLHWVINSCSFCPEAQAQVFTLLADLIVQGGAPVVQSIDRSGMIVSMLAIFCGSPIKETRLKVAQVIGTLATSPELGPKMTSLFVTFFTSNFEEAILNAKQEPSKLIELYDGDNEAPQLFWNNETRKDMVNTLIREINPIIQSLAKQQKPLQPQEGKEKAEQEGYVWDSSTLAKRYKRPAMEREFTVGGYYIRFFNNDPLHYVKSINADTFLEAIVAFIKQNCDTSVSSSSGKKDKEKKKKKKKEKEEGATTTTELSSVMEEKLSMCWEAVVGLLTARSAYKKHAGVRELVPFVMKQLQQALERFDSTEIGSLYYFMLDAFLILARKKDIEKELDPVEVLRIVLSFCHKNPKRHSTILLFLQDYVEADSANAARLKAAGGLFYLLEILFSPNTKHQEEVVTVLLAMVSDKKVGEATTEFIQRFFSHKQASAVAENRADKLLEMLEKEHSSEGRGWHPLNSKAALHTFVSSQTSSLDASWKKGEWDGKKERWNVDKHLIENLYSTLGWK